MATNYQRGFGSGYSGITAASHVREAVIVNAVSAG